VAAVVRVEPNFGEPYHGRQRRKNRPIRLYLGKNGGASRCNGEGGSRRSGVWTPSSRGGATTA
jgi:hypothetical protein